MSDAYEAFCRRHRLDPDDLRSTRAGAWVEVAVDELTARAERAEAAPDSALLQEAAAIIDALIVKSDCRLDRNQEFAAAATWKTKVRGGLPLMEPLDCLRNAEAAQRVPLTEAQIEAGRQETFSTGNPFCPCDSKTMRKAVRWAEHTHGITATEPTAEAAQRVPPGYALVPVNPTEAMLRPFFGCAEDVDFAFAWQAMLTVTATEPTGEA